MLICSRTDCQYISPKILVRHQRCPRTTFPCAFRTFLCTALNSPFARGNKFYAEHFKQPIVGDGVSTSHIIPDETSWTHTRVRHYNWSFFIFGTLFQSVGECRHHNYELRITNYALKTTFRVRKYGTSWTPSPTFVFVN